MGKDIRVCVYYSQIILLSLIISLGELQVGYSPHLCCTYEATTADTINDFRSEEREMYIY